MQTEGAPAPSSLPGGPKPSHPFFSLKPVRLLIRFGMLAILDAFSLLFIWTLIANGRYPLAAFVFVITVGVNIAFLVEKAYPFRWFAPGLALMILMLVYPTAYTLYVAFTNYGDGNLLTRVQVIDQIESRTFAPEGATEYSWTAFRSNSDPDEYVLWIQTEGESFLAEVGEELTTLDNASSAIRGSLDASGIPTDVPGFTRLAPNQIFAILDALTEITFGEEPNTVTVDSVRVARRLEQRYLFDSVADTFTDQRTGVVYTPVQGTFTADDGSTLSPGYWVPVGGENFRRLFRSPSLRGPFIRVLIWTFAFAVFSVLLTFSVGLFFAMVFDHPNMPAKNVLRSLVLIPYALPAFITANIWRGMFLPQFGVISTTLENLFGSSPLWLADPTWAKVGILIIQTWLGFPYMMIICTGALQSLPSDIFEAATIDGAGPLRKFWNLTLPLLLVSVGPLLIASFAFNFNNFTLIDIYAEGGPPIVGTLTPAGHTDILITYVFRLAFSGGRGADFGYASAITMVIFLILATITALQFRFTRIWEEISENV